MRYRYSAAVLLLAASGCHAAEVCTILADAASGKTLMQRGDCGRRVTPASTLKIPLSLMGYDAGFLKDTKVWYSQQITRSLGMPRFAAYTRQFGFGNADLSGDPKHDGLTLSWINSSLKISPLEQTAFLARLVNRKLGVSAHAYDMTARLTEYGTLAGWKVNGKTGSGGDFGWYVGWAAKGERTLVFAHLVQSDASQPEGIPAAVWARDGLIAELPGLLEAAR
jgi:beta-lactamase class D